MPSSFTDIVWLQSDERFDRNFCVRVTQLQLSTDSWDQGNVRDIKAGRWTWFELVILRGDSTSDEPKYRDGKELA
ncbi:hypothetical protein BKA70DRAFT_1435208 [Coprinopsis sp. MPI-PUGE-AT-0042]|nr:hypothetical protein BKA70DRAFT_1435208 [Coprinopsis sp. MPI-PUGE-AT-0042]